MANHTKTSFLGVPWLVAALSFCGCTDLDDPPLFVETEYRVRCIGCDPPALDEDTREVFAVDGEQGLAIRCDVSRAGSRRVLTFSANFDSSGSEDDYGLRFIQYDLDGGGDPGNRCSVEVQEGANTYEGSCTGDDPDDDARCRIRMEEDSGIVTGSVLCEQMQNTSSPSITRHLVKPGTRDEAAEFEIHGCRGL